MTWIPAYPEMERHVLGAFFLDPSGASQAMEILVPEDFYLEKHSLIWQAIGALQSESKGVDVFSLCEFLSRQGKLEAAGGREYLFGIEHDVASSANIEAHARLVKELAKRRDLIQGAARLYETAKTEGKENRQVLADAEAILLSLSQESSQEGLKSFKSYLPATLRAIDEIADGRLTGVPTGLVDLDRITGGLQATDLVIVAGRPGMGKTGLGLSIAWRAAAKGKRVAFFSLEMGAEQLQQRVLCAYRNLDIFQLRTRGVAKREAGEAALALQDIPLHIDEAARKTPLQMLSQARRMKHREGLDLLVFDYLQLGSMEKQQETRALEVGAFAYSLKALAKDLKIPVLALCQLNRAIEGRGTAEPRLSDLRESGKIEEAADIVFFVHRPWVQDHTQPETYAELLIGKYRNGPQDSAIKLRFNKESASFSDHIEPGFMEGVNGSHRHRSTGQAKETPDYSVHAGAGRASQRQPRPGEPDFDG